MIVMFNKMELIVNPISLEYKEGGLRKMKVLHVESATPYVAVWNEDKWVIKETRKKNLTKVRKSKTK